MAADPVLDRIAAAFVQSVGEAGPNNRFVMSDITRRFIDQQLNVYEGEPVELGAVFLSLYAKLTKMDDWMGPQAAARALAFFLGSAGTQLYLRRYPANHTATSTPPAHAAHQLAQFSGLLLTAGNSGPWLVCRDGCTGNEQIVVGFDDRIGLDAVVAAAADHRNSLHAAAR